MHGRNIFDLLHTSWRWPIIIVCVVVLFINASGTIKIDALLDSTPEENINKFLSNVENINPDYTMGKEKSGIKVYDENRIIYNMMYGMGHEEYFVYVFTKDLQRDSEINLALERYVSTENSLPVYSIDTSLLDTTIDSVYSDLAPVVLKMVRDNSGDGKPVTSVQYYYNNVDLINSEMFTSIEDTEPKTPNTDKGNIKEEEPSGNWITNLFKGEESKSEPETKDELVNEEKPGFFDKLFSKDGELR